MAFTLFTHMYVPGSVMFLPIFHILLSAVSQCLNEVTSAAQRSFVTDQIHCTIPVQFNMLIVLSCDEV